MLLMIVMLDYSFDRLLQVNYLSQSLPDSQLVANIQANKTARQTFRKDEIRHR